MLKKVSFFEPSCTECPSYSAWGDFPCETRYCMAKGRKGKRFKAHDPKFRAPKWCPKRLPSRVCRVYRLKDIEESIERVRRAAFDLNELTYYPAAGYRYAPEPRLEKNIGYTVRQFYERVNEDGPEYILDELGLEFGDLFELDDGLRPYYFYYFGPGVVLPATVSGIPKQEGNGKS